MKYGVIVCPKCNSSKAVELYYKTSRCNRCGKILVIDKLKIFYKTNSKQDLIQAIGLINAQIDGKLDNFKKVIKE
jgi:hypothetical protein